MERLIINVIELGILRRNLIKYVQKYYKGIFVYSSGFLLECA